MNTSLEVPYLGYVITAVLTFIDTVLASIVIFKVTWRMKHILSSGKDDMGEIHGLLVFLFEFNYNASGLDYFNRIEYYAPKVIKILDNYGKNIYRINPKEIELFKRNIDSLNLKYNNLVKLENKIAPQKNKELDELGNELEAKGMPINEIMEKLMKKTREIDEEAQIYLLYIEINEIDCQLQEFLTKTYNKMKKTLQLLVS